MTQTDKQAHTPGPLRFHTQGSGFQFSTGKVAQKDDKLIGFISGVTTWRRGEAEANAHRIVATWNACEGISTKALDQGVVAALLAACELLLVSPLSPISNCPADLSSQPCVCGLHEAQNHARAVIARAKGVLIAGDVPGRP